MRKLLTFLCAALMSVGMFATTVVTITQNDFPQYGQSFTKDGVTVSAGMIDGDDGNLMGGGSFSTTLGNFTKIEVTCEGCEATGTGWSGNFSKKTWEGTPASTVSFSDNFMGMGMGITIVCTIEEPTVAVTGVTLNQSEAQMTVGGETLTLTATVNPNNATDQSVSWSTSNADIATVENGVVTAVAAGNATITVTTTDGSFTATCAVTVTAPQPAATVVTITDSDIPGWGDSFTKDGVTVSAEMIDDMYGNISGPGSFSTTLGNFTKIEVNANYVGIAGEGWSGDSEHKTWTGNASSVSFTGDINGDEEGLTLKFTIEPASTPEPENSCGDGLTWELNAGVLTISYDGVGTGDMYDYLYFEDPAPWDSSKESITSVIISNGVTRIGYYAFAGCTSLTTVTIPNSVTSIGYSAFYNCSSLTSVTIPNSVTSIEAGVFSGCSSLTSVTFGNSVTSIGNYAFLRCTGLTSITIPNSVTSIEEGAFAKCSNLETVTILAESLESYGTNAFDGTAAALKIYVPAGSVDTYKAAENWSAYADKIEAIPAPEPQGETITVTWNSYDLPSSGSSFTKDGVTLTCDIDDDLYGPGTFTTNLGNFTQIVVSGDGACYIDATDGWSGNYDQKTWTGNAAIVPFDGSIYSFSSDVTIVFTIEPSGTATAVENVQTNPVQATKILRDGQLLIEKDGKIFNVTGAQVR